MLLRFSALLIDHFKNIIIIVIYSKTSWSHFIEGFKSHWSPFSNVQFQGLDNINAFSDFLFWTRIVNNAIPDGPVNYSGSFISIENKMNRKGANYDDNHSFSLLLSKSNFFLYDSSDGGSRRVAGPCS